MLGMKTMEEQLTNLAIINPNKGFDGNACDRTDLRLKHRVKHRLHRLKILQASVQYAEVPDSYWEKKGKELVDKVTNLPADIAAQVAAEMLKNPML